MTDRGERYLDLHQVAEKVGLSTKSVRSKVRTGEFPPPFKWGGGFKWLESDVDRWMVANAVRLTIKPEEMPEPKTARGKARKSAEDR